VEEAGRGVGRLGAEGGDTVMEARLDRGAPEVDRSVG
jgi:hypothetical protein